MSDPIQQGQSNDSITALMEETVGSPPGWMRRSGELISALMISAAAFLQFFGPLKSYEVRWTVAGIVITLCLLSLLAPLLGFKTRPSRFAPLLYTGIACAIGVIAIDMIVLWNTLSQPADCIWSSVRVFRNEEGMRAYLGRQRALCEVADISESVLREPYHAQALYTNPPNYLDLKIVRRPHVKRLVVDDFEVEVIDFVPVPTFYPNAFAAAPTQGFTTDVFIPYVFVGADDLRPEPLPWKFNAEYLLSDSQAKDAELWVNYDRQLSGENDYARYRLLLVGRSPGLYVCNVYVIANNQRVLCTPRPITYFYFSVIGKEDASQNWSEKDIFRRDSERDRLLKEYHASLREKSK